MHVTVARGGVKSNQLPEKERRRKEERGRRDELDRK